MKHQILTALFLVFISTSAFAQAIGGGGSSGTGLFKKISISIINDRCLQGTWAEVSVERNGRIVNEMRQCQQGSFYSLVEREYYFEKYRTKCPDGKRMTRSERDVINDRTVRTSVICTDGKWIEEKK